MKKCPVCSRAYSDMVTTCPVCHTNLVSNSAGTTAQTPVPPQNYSAPVNQQPSSYQPQPVQPQPVQTSTGTSNQQSTPDKGNWLWFLPGLLIPLAGLIAWLCLKKNHPASAKIASSGALVGFLLNMALQFI